ncbi:uncharacterized protein N7483_012028 [Penicillium malachiteum]|uniref:uncharacterized protein n=1 Tax=Penicillium malachiteum TaxID=1324776 RepID=UPI0025467A04|nr:uncharacterized protein N7483_012028 [Penicillium malachiteum]KAJ5714847.1 hypothetical protein N7483_012028 [Penicillium malachiteum]
MHACQRAYRGGDSWTIVDQVIWHPKSEEVLGLYMGGQVFKWNPQTNAQQELDAEGSVLACSAEGKFFAVGGSHGTIKLYNFQHFSMIYRLSYDQSITRICFSADSKRLYDIRVPWCNIWEPSAIASGEDHEDESDLGGEAASIATTNVSESLAEVRARTTAIAVDPRGRCHATGNEDGVVSMICPSDGKMEAFELWRSSFQLPIAHLDRSSDGKLLACVEMASRVVVNRVFRDMTGTFAIQPVFRDDVDLNHGAIDQVLLNSNGAMILIKHGSSVDIQPVNLTPANGLSFKIQSPDTRWRNHPTNHELLLAVSSTTLCVHRWDDLSQVTSMNFTTPTDLLTRLDPDVTVSLTNLDLRRKVHGSVQRLCTSGPFLLVHMVLPTNLNGENYTSWIEFPDSVGTPCSITIPEEIQRQIRLPLGFLPQKRIVFLDKKYWICSWSLDFNPNSGQICDGGIPACSNCARAHVSCIDVHTGNNDLSIPRDFAANCRARIKWLEQQITTMDPNFDLSRGPNVDLHFLENTTNQSSEAGRAYETPAEPQVEVLDKAFPAESTANKRSHSSMESGSTSPISAKVRSVAIDLGMLSLQSDSRQRHYLGSSSGLLFTKLLGLGNERCHGNSAFRTRRSNTSKVSDEIYKNLYYELERELPSPEEACTLLEVYFQNVQVELPFMHPQSILNVYDALLSCVKHGYDGSTDQNGWTCRTDDFPYNGRFDTSISRNATPISIFTGVLHLFMVFSIAATLLTRKNNYDHSPARFQGFAMSTASEALAGISVTSLQAILLLAVQGIIEPAGVNIWTLSHIAMSHCVDLGMHREPEGSEVSGVTVTVSRLIFFSVYSLDRSVATIQGRPLGIRDETFDIQPARITEITEMMTLSVGALPIKLASNATLSFTISKFCLDRHISDIKLILYHLPTRSKIFLWPTNIPEIQSRLNLDLEQWLANVQMVDPPQNVDEEERVQFETEKMKHEQLYHSAITLLFQPSQAFPCPRESALLKCYRSCSRRLQIYDILSNNNSLSYDWRNIHGIFSSGATIVYCAWVSREVQRTIPLSKLLRDLRICSNHLSIGSQWWPSVKNGKRNFETMIDLVIKHFDELRLQELALPPHQKRRHIDGEQSIVTKTPSLMNELGSDIANPESIHQDIHNIQPQGSVMDDQAYESGSKFYQNPHFPLSGPNTWAIPQANPSSVFLEASLFNDYIAATEPHLPLEDEQISPFTNDQFHLPDTPSIEVAMESFMAEFLHDDWGWDPFPTL